MSEKLLPCPFCGPGNSCVDLWHDDVAKRWRVGCGACGCSTGTSPRDKTKAPAIAAWNRRTPAPEGEAWTEDAELERRQEDYERGFRDGLAAAPIVPAPEGEAVKSYGQKGRALYEAFWARNGDASPPPWDEQARAIRDMWVNITRDAEPLYASPVVPVGVSREAVERVCRLMARLEATMGEDPIGQDRLPSYIDENWRDYESEVLAALRPTDTGRE